VTKFKIDRYARGDESPIVTIEIIRETEKCYWVKNAYRRSGEEKNLKDSSMIYDTFDIAKAEYIRQRQEAVENTKKRIVDLRNALERAEKLLAAAPYLEAPHA